MFEASIGDCSEILGDISDQIFKIMFDPELTEEERNIKIEKMADNEVGKVQELHRLEQEEKSLYGFDLSKYIIDKDVQDAENPWISAQCINEMVNAFLDDYLGPGDYIRGKGDGKNLRLSLEKRQLLLDDLRTMQLPANNNAVKPWKAYLKSNTASLSVTFDSKYAKDNRNTAFLTQMHPLVMDAAAYESKKFPCNVSMRIADPEIPSGDYEFLIYAWRYVGLRPDIKLIAVSDNDAVEKNVLSFLRYASESNSEGGPHDEEWDSMDHLHYVRWQEAEKAYIKEVRAECDYRLEQINHSSNQQELIVIGKRLLYCVCFQRK